ncbi:hypothetical protein ACFQFC_38620 [Amorphoplanes digitatis]|uniref:Lipoprotein n=1 Tax=Actinoplanes digitatis TaxID=1868 RepID=A0A7W7MPF6_9ACTN|nr:hypothetical protein [Actinoplanes digitatis]MBB4762081.1 hypothetical protein [Actinoplanes digitatis]GID97052.1 hypothetical protein Adi01nite_64640 [Actinoplanes digitatis]
MIRYARTAAVAAVLTLGLLTACGEDEAPSVATSAPAAPGPDGAKTGCAPPGEGAHQVVADGRTVTGVAPGLGLPAGSRIEHLAGAESAATVTLSAPGPEIVLEHYRRQGPECGYTIVSNEDAVLYLTGRGWGVQVITQGSRSTVAFMASPEQPMG